MAGAKTMIKDVLLPLLYACQRCGMPSMIFSKRDEGRLFCCPDCFLVVALDGEEGLDFLVNELYGCLSTWHEKPL